MTITSRSVVFSALTLLVAVSVLPARELSIDERVTAQKAIEQIYWNHRIWPKENPGAKPQLAAVMSNQTIRAKVDDYLRMSNALERFWQRPVTAEQLQAELDRMASNTRDGATLQELFGALGNDPFVIAETLGRQTLVERLIRNWYANDTRFHGDAKAKAEAALLACRSLDCMKAMGGEYSETTWRLRAAAGVAPDETRDHAVLLDADEWTDHVGRLAKNLGATADSIPVRRLSSLEETRDAVIVTAVLSRREGELKTASVLWPKRSFDSWWNNRRNTTEAEVAVASGTFALPNAPSTVCTLDTWRPTLFETPDPRESHSAVWTGTEMIVWGGFSGAYLNTGGRYSPSTDSWTLTSTATDVPSARTRHAAVWTGTEMIVWGGYNAAYLNTGGRYSPSTDTWAATSTLANVPSARDLHTVVWTGTEMIVWGGSIPDPIFGSVPVNTGRRYDPVGNTWTATSTGTNVPSARHGHTAVWTGTEMIVWGGYGGAYLNTGGRYSPSGNTWTPTLVSAAISGRHAHTAVWTGTRMIVWGGSDDTVVRPTAGGNYSPSANTWTAISTLGDVPTGRTLHTAVWTGTQMIIWGGADSAGDSLSSLGRYVPSSDSWLATSVAANVPTARTLHTALWTGTEMIVWGGNDVGYFNSGGRYNPDNDSWIATSEGMNVPNARSQHSAVWTGTEMIVWGGNNGFYLNSGGRMTPATDSWTPTSMGVNLPAQRGRHTAVWTGTEMVVWAGTNGTRLNTGGRYRPSDNSWMTTSSAANVPAARDSHAAVWTGTEMIVWGGSTGSLVNTGGRYNPVSDSWTATSTGANVPAARDSHSAVWTGAEMIIWGGRLQSGSANTGGRYFPSSDSWIPTSTGANVPAARGSHTAVWTGTEMIVWGGVGQGGSLNTGGRFIPSPSSWTTTSAGANVPSARSGHTALWTGTEMIVWGGNSNTGGRYDSLNDFWTPTSTGTDVPASRSGHVAVWTGPEMIVWGGIPATSSGGHYCACPNGGTYFRDADGDSYGDHGASTSICTGSIPVGYVADFTDCNDANPAVHPGIPELCNGIDDDCDTVVPIAEADADGDGVRICSGDCNDASPFVYPGAPEVNDGLDNQCPGNPGSGVIDEVSGVSGFLSPSDDTLFSWPAQAGATSYEVARSPFSDFHAGCVHHVTASTSWSDSATPTPSGRFYYLVRSVSPYLGSWGRRNPAAERIVCAGCVSTGDWCDDGSVCTMGDTCTGTSCAGAPVSCNDAQVCTDDSCNAVSGCVHTNNTAPCTDGSVCTINDTCSGGTCIPGTPLSCDDGNPCTNDSCNPVSGCAHANNNAACNDGNACTTGDTCGGGVCAGTIPPVANHLVISQIQTSGDGANAGSDEFIEIYNPTSSPVSLSNWSLQLATIGSFGSFSVESQNLSGTIPAHGWFLVAPFFYNGPVIKDQTAGLIMLGGSKGNVLLVNSISDVTSCSSGSIVDKVTYGSGSSCAEGVAAPAPSANNSILRLPGGACGNGTDTDSNPADFVLQTPSTPRNSTSPPQP